jgi:hypothetical protein
MAREHGSVLNGARHSEPVFDCGLYRYRHLTDRRFDSDACAIEFFDPPRVQTRAGKISVVIMSRQDMPPFRRLVKVFMGRQSSQQDCDNTG